MASRVGIVGASGYSGAVLARLVATHPNAKLTFITSDRHQGERARDRLGGFFEPDLVFSSNKAAVDQAAKCDVVFLATSAEVSARLAPAFLDRGKLTIDLSGAFRLPDKDAYPAWYGFDHPSPSHLAGAFYGLPELFGAPPEDAGIVANPGCYATATLLALAPLLAAGVIEPKGIVVDAKSGVTGAGRHAEESFSFVEINEDLRAYKVLSHQHTPEIERGVATSARVDIGGFAFVPHLLPLSRGLLVTCYAKAKDPERATEALNDAYSKTSFVRVTEIERASIHSVAGTNFAHVGVAARGETVVIVTALDNLLKGAAGQAVQNMNLALGLDETTGLRALSRWAP